MSESRSKRPHVLLAAYDCGPTKGSASKIGWHWYSHLAPKIPVTLVTHIRNREDLLEAGAPLFDSKIIFIDTEFFAKPVCYLAEKIFPTAEHARTLLCSPDFYLYDFLAVRKLKALRQTGERWDIVHLVTPVSPVAATRLHVLKRPVVLGPWNGGLKSPTEFPEIMREEASWLYPIRYLGHLIDVVTGTTRQASAILTATTATIQSIPARYHSRCRPVLENGVDLNLFTPTPWTTLPSRTQTLQLIFVARFQPFKGLPMLLEAIAQLKIQFPIHLTIVGDGPLREKWENQAKHLQINDLMTWYGQASLAQVAEQIQQSHVLCLPSIRESGGGVLLEAMACARPVIALKYGGPAEIIDDEIGYAIPIEGGPIAVIAGLVDCISDIFKYPQAWQQKGIVARQRVEQLYSWEVKIDQALALYQELLNQNQNEKISS
jgi:glycosyltransferase involved in cell wall biosynthesis